MKNNLITRNKMKHNIWINMVNPSEEELKEISKITDVSIEFLSYPLDEEETARIDMEKDAVLILFDIPFTDFEGNSLVYDTYPLGIIYVNDYIITICLKNSNIFEKDLKDKKVEEYEGKEFILNIISNVYIYYSLYLRQINHKISLIEKYLSKSVKNEYLLQLYSLRKSLVYFSISLKSNELVLEKMLRLNDIVMNDKYLELLNDIIIEHKQNLEMATRYSYIISNTMNFFSYIISNNLNIEMKKLAMITVFLSIPTIISSIFGMNKILPISKEDPRGLPIVILIMIISYVIVIPILSRINSPQNED